MSRLSVMPHPSYYESPMPSGKSFIDDSRASSFSGIPASPPPSIGVPATAGIPNSPLLRNGTIIKNHRRQPSNLRPASKYKIKERAAPTEGKWVFIVNGLKLKQWEVVAPRLLKQLSLVEVKVYATKYVGHGRRLAEKAARNGADLVGAVGGDGTLNEVIDGIMRAGVMGPDGLPRAVVTVLPLGTASDFHRSMAWEPYDFEEAMWRIGKRGETAVLDVARIRCASPEGIKERHFINIASCGASARAALKVDRWRWLGQKSSYRMAAVAALFRYMPRNLAVRVNNGEWTKAAGTTMIAIGNGSYFGCGINMCPDANPYDGELQVVKAKRMGVCDFLFRRHRLKIGRHLDMKGFSAENAARIDVALWDNRRRGPKETLGMFGNTSMTNTYDSSPGDASPEPSFTTHRTESAEIPSPAERASSSRGQLEYSPSGSERSARSASGRSLSTLSSSMTRSGSAAGRKNGKKELKEADYGPVPVEVDGEVIGHVPFSVTVLPGAIKFRVSGFRTDE